MNVGKIGQVFHIRVAGTNENTIRAAAEEVMTTTRSMGKPQVIKASKQEARLLNVEKWHSFSTDARLTSEQKKSLYKELTKQPGRTTVSFVEVNA